MITATAHADEEVPDTLGNAHPHVCRRFEDEPDPAETCRGFLGGDGRRRRSRRTRLNVCWRWVGMWVTHRPSAPSESRQSGTREWTMGRCRWAAGAISPARATLLVHARTQWACDSPLIVGSIEARDMRHHTPRRAGSPPKGDCRRWAAGAISLALAPSVSAESWRGTSPSFCPAYAPVSVDEDPSPPWSPGARRNGGGQLCSGPSSSVRRPSDSMPAGISSDEERL